MSMNGDDNFRVRPLGMDPEAHAEAVREGLGKIRVGWTPVVVSVASGVAAVCLGWNLPGWGFALAVVGAVVVPVVVLGLIAAQQLPRTMGHAMRAHGANVCSACGYSLEKLERVEKCPECGARVVDMVRIGSAPLLARGTPARVGKSPIVMPPGLREREDGRGLEGGDGGDGVGDR